MTFFERFFVAEIMQLPPRGCDAPLLDGIGDALVASDDLRSPFSKRERATMRRSYVSAVSTASFRLGAI
jgi:hypothetical protein